MNGKISENQSWKSSDQEIGVKCIANYLIASISIATEKSIILTFQHIRLVSDSKMDKIDAMFQNEDDQFELIQS